MLSNPRRTIALVGGVFVLVVATAVAYLLLPPRQTADVTLPPPDATPEQVVTAYLNALNAHDCDTAEAVSTEDAKESATSWCHHVDSLTAVTVGRHVQERPEWTGHSPADEIVNVPVTFDLTWRPFRSDGSMDEGVTTWGYLLVRESASRSWRIFDQGHA